jgi:hypothetical protein
MVDGCDDGLVGAGPGSTSAPTNSNMFRSSFRQHHSAEFGQPGMRINLVPRDGGNQFHGTVFSSYTKGAW